MNGCINDDVVKREKRENIKTHSQANMITVNPDRTEQLVSALVALWEASVRATHHFLTEEDICHLIPFVNSGVVDIQTLLIVSDHGQPVAFMGIDGAKIEMLFVVPSCFGRGMGKQLIAFATIHYGVQYVDVNEQNPQAVGFYRHIGFKETARTSHDEQGNPFPILQMKREFHSL